MDKISLCYVVVSAIAHIRRSLCFPESDPRVVYTRRYSLLELIGRDEDIACASRLNSQRVVVVQTRIFPVYRMRPINRDFFFANWDREIETTLPRIERGRRDNERLARA